MDFARKQLQKFGWTEGSGLGKSNQGIATAVKPVLRTGNEGLGFDLAKDLVDPWWTRAYDDSLKRISISTTVDTATTSDSLHVSFREDDISADEDDCDLKLKQEASDRPFHRMRKRMMKTNFVTFSKGATLRNGDLQRLSEAVDTSDSDSDDDQPIDASKSQGSKTLTDEELFRACGGRTVHKAARFGLNLNGKLARLAAQEKAAAVATRPNVPVLPGEASANCKDLPKEGGKEKLKRKVCHVNEATVENEYDPHPNSSPPPVPAENASKSEVEKSRKNKKRKKEKRHKYALEEEDRHEEDVVGSINERPDSTCNEEVISSKKTKNKKRKATDPMGYIESNGAPGVEISLAEDTCAKKEKRSAKKKSHRK